jgi:hypothetical protein
MKFDDTQGLYFSFLVIWKHFWNPWFFVRSLSFTYTTSPKIQIRKQGFLSSLKGVHAVNNVFSIIVNSQLSEDKICAGETIGERDFVSILNRQLPDSIIVTSWAPVDLEFSGLYSFEKKNPAIYPWKSKREVTLITVKYV